MSTQTAKLDVTALVNCVARLSEGLDTYTRNDNSPVFTGRNISPRPAAGASAVIDLVLDLEPAHLRIVTDILRAHLPSTVQVWAFGSRVTGKARRYSDLDLAVDAGRRLNSNETGSLYDDFTESDLPWKVDVVDLHGVSDYFRKIVEAARVALPL